MQIFGVVGARGTGTTATAVDLVAALRTAGHHAAVVDLSGDVCELFDVEVSATLSDALSEDAPVRETIGTVELPPDTVETALDAYAETIARDRTAFRTTSGGSDPGEPQPTALPVVPGGDRRRFGDVDDARLEEVRADLAFAFDVLVADAGTLGPAVATLPDGLLVVTDTSDKAVVAARRATIACTDQGIPVAGAIVNAAADWTDVSAFVDRLGLDVWAVVPDDGRQRSVEPIPVTAPASPAAAAYARLAEAVVAWDGTHGLVDGGPERPTATEERDAGGGLLAQVSSRLLALSKRTT